MLGSPFGLTTISHTLEFELVFGLKINAPIKYRRRNRLVANSAHSNYTRTRQQSK